ncbi:MAG: hypothetical protein J2P37_31810 [Ktedonobacteraceae bacterium]|nr:hypothetical protein [Ktedonobacteraceae bacterium]
MTEEQQPQETPGPSALASKPHAEVAAIIAERLGETEEAPRKQICSIVQAGGRTLAVSLLKQTLQLEASGGMMLPNGSRRRTPGVSSSTWHLPQASARQARNYAGLLHSGKHV